MAPCLLVLEDIDSLIDDDVRSYFLNEVDGLTDNDGLLILGTTNHCTYSTSSLHLALYRHDYGARDVTRCQHSELVLGSG